MKKLCSVLICISILLSSVIFALPTSATTPDQQTIEEQQLAATDSYFYDRINAQQQWCYKYIKEIYDNFDAEPGIYEFDVTDQFPTDAPQEYYDLLGRDFMVAKLALCADYPLYEICGYVNFASVVNVQGQRYTFIRVLKSDFEREDVIARTEARINQIVQTIGEGDRYTELYKLAHYYISNTFYEPYLDILKTPNSNNERELEARMPNYDSTPYGIFLENVAICGGFAGSVKVLCNELDIPCIIMGNNKHAWNLVQMEDGSWYRFDMTNAVSVGWDGKADIEDYFRSEFLENNTFGAAELYKDPYMIGLNNISYVTEFPEVAEQRYQYTGPTTDFSYTEVPSAYVPGAPNFIYRVHRDKKTCTIVYYEGKEEGDLIIPSELDGYTVTQIGACAFYYCTGFDGKLAIPDTVQKIERAAFAGCYNIKEVEFSDNLSIIEHGAFIGCKGLSQITLPDSLVTVGDVAFFDCNNLLSVNIGSHLQLVDKRVFGYNRNFEVINGFSISAPENSVAQEYALNNAITFIPRGTTCNFVDDDGEWEFLGEEHFHTCSHGVRFDVEEHIGEGGTHVSGCGKRCVVCNAQHCATNGFMESVEIIKDARPSTCTNPAYSGDIWCICEQFMFSFGTDVGTPIPHSPQTEDWLAEEWIHYQACSCGYQLNIGSHEGGEATTTQRAICDVCGAEYGELLHIHTPKDGSWHSEEWIHYQVCECGYQLNIGGHEGGEATTTQRAICDTCGTEYGELLHAHTSIDGTWLSNDFGEHFQLCECGEKFNLESHRGGEATTTQRAICDVCGVEYGDLLHIHTPQNDSWLRNNDVHYQLCECGYRLNVEAHEPIDAWITADMMHYQACKCGHQLNIGDHEGGEATTTQRAICDTCGAEYGDLLHAHTPVNNEWIIEDDIHYRLCECGERFDLGTHSGGTATTTEYAKCDICGADYGELVHVHNPIPDYWDNNEYTHWQLCTCGEHLNEKAHYGGTATTNDLAICEVCGVGYGEMLHAHSPIDDSWISTGGVHYQLCECGRRLNAEAHYGGTATTTELALCEVCGAEYGELLHSHTPMPDYWDRDEYTHWQLCEDWSCDVRLNEEAHHGGTATTGSLAICEVCGVAYGDFFNDPNHEHSPIDNQWFLDDYGHYQRCACGAMFNIGVHHGGTATTTERAKCVVCGMEYGELRHEHDPDYSVWKTDNRSHWHLCECGEVFDDEPHRGGTATETERAICEICGTEYGELYHEHAPKDDSWVILEGIHYQLCECGKRLNSGSHTGGKATETERAKCKVCGAEYGEFAKPVTTEATVTTATAAASTAPQTEAETTSANSAEGCEAVLGMGSVSVIALSLSSFICFRKKED